MGLIQHHDAISGTERQHVADDYVQRLSDGVDAAIVSDKNRRMIFFSLIITMRNKAINFFKYNQQKNSNNMSFHCSNNKTHKIK
jgi:hypothetical protein